MQQDRNTADLGADRPLTARSVVASMLLGMDPPESSGRMLVRSGELFGIAEGTTRTAMSRMLAAGELESAGGGRYRLAGPLLARQLRQRESRRPAFRRWRSDWHTAVVVAEGRSPAERGALRSTLASLRMAELREGCWLRPANLEVSPPAPIADQCRWFLSTPTGGTDEARKLAASLWDLDGWSRLATALLDRLDATGGALRSGDVGRLPSCFVLAAAVLRHVQADPLLPDSLLPTGWPGSRLRSTYEHYERDLQALLRSWFATERHP